ncbi:hypothetical protein ERJ75_001060900 [Trypanosoma vivax]|nr:hypothetical protein ERJ75_001060900 [Trypanosoma vivax]
MGYECGPEILRTVARALAGERAVVSSKCAAPKPIENTRLGRQYSNQRLAVVELESLASHVVCAPGVCGVALLGHYFFRKAVRQRLSKLSGGLLQLNGSSGLPAHAVRQGKRWLSALLGNRPIAPRRHRPASAALATDASMRGWGALLFKDGGEVCGGWRVATTVASHHAGRGACRVAGAQFFCRSSV